MLDPHRLELLRELSIRGTMAAVAESLKYSPSAVSQQLTLLEKEAGTTLFRKVGRRVQLTPQADILVRAAGELADVLERAETELQASHTTIRGRVRVAVFQSAALALMPEALLRMAEQHPEVRVEMVQKEPEEALHETWARDFDLVIAEQYPAHSVAWLPGLHRRDLTSDEIMLAVPPARPASGRVSVPVAVRVPGPAASRVPGPAASRVGAAARPLAVGLTPELTAREPAPFAESPGHGVVAAPGRTATAITAPATDADFEPALTSIQHARGRAWVMEPAGTASRHFAEQLCRSAGFEPDVRYETADLQTHIRLVESGNAVALLPNLLWAGREVSCTLLALAGHPHRTIFTAQREAGLQSPAVEAVRSALEQSAARF
ncbi:LysR family transcriptional regulator [Subtercola endophyticus]|uniref:LysR family transcriptional regulator n=1 Tax=Subtercola endophyticus TaxID=2895559 RepID=UPI001E63303F|nr:LysR family transcriptional regulator [Subtercola endophyticus]UFS58241.1 LysR family transcriptional regulator [Subtercola endophyticus]